jgi:hypothetical protein
VNWETSLFIAEAAFISSFSFTSCLLAYLRSFSLCSLLSDIYFIALLACLLAVLCSSLSLSLSLRLLRTVCLLACRGRSLSQKYTHTHASYRSLCLAGWYLSHTIYAYISLSQSTTRGGVEGEGALALPSSRPLFFLAPSLSHPTPFV